MASDSDSSIDAYLTGVLSPHSRGRHKSVWMGVGKILTYSKALRSRGEMVLMAEHGPSMEETSALLSDILTLRLGKLADLVNIPENQRDKTLYRDLTRSVSSTFGNVHEHISGDPLVASIYSELGEVANKSLTDFRAICQRTSEEVLAWEKVARDQRIWEEYSRQYSMFPEQEEDS